MMFHTQCSSRQHCSLLAVLSSKSSFDKQKQVVSEDIEPSYPIPELSSSGRLEVQVLTKPNVDEFHLVLQSTKPSIVYFQGELIENNEEIGSLKLGNAELSTPEAICGLFGSTLPSAVYLDVPNGEELAEALHFKVCLVTNPISKFAPTDCLIRRVLSGSTNDGVSYVIFWRNKILYYEALNFRQAFLSVIQSSCSHICDAFQLAHASFRLYCVPSSKVETFGSKLGPLLLGDPPRIDVPVPEADDEGEEDSSVNAPAIKIYDEDVKMRFLVCGVSSTLDDSFLGSLEDGLNALLNIEIRGSKLHNRTSAPLPPLQAGTFSRGVVTMRCDLSTCSSAHVSLLVSGSANTCFNDQLLENHIKNEVIENSHLVHACSEEEKLTTSEPRKSACIACGASVFEVCMRVPTWASQVLRQLAPDISYRSLVVLGIAGIQGLSVASFEKDDAHRLLFFCTQQGKEVNLNNGVSLKLPSWLIPPPPSRIGSEPNQGKSLSSNGFDDEHGVHKRKFNVASMRPIPHTRRHKMLPFSVSNGGDKVDGDHVKLSIPTAPAKHSVAGPASVTHRKLLSSSYQAQQIISLNPLPLKKHGCGRAPIQVCSEEEFLRDVMQFLILRGHTRLVPQGGLAEFPDAILNAKRLDLFNLYREVVSRGGFHVGNGINWKGQVFSKMRNHTLTNRMTGVGNTLKRHYETYLLEYELAHDDVDGECCLLCHSSAAGDWVNCGMCGEWAHFGCDRRQGLGAFKDYAKTDGLEYICPHCSVANFKKKKIVNGY